MICYFSGTGNSLRVAKTLADALADRLVNMAELPLSPEMLLGEKQIGFVFPVYAWGLPSVVERYVQKMARFIGKTKPYVYAVLTCGDDVGYTDSLLSKLLAERGLALQAAFSVQMRNTYVCLPGFDIDDADTAKRKEAALPSRLAHIAKMICSRGAFSPRELHRGSIPRLKTYVFRPFFRRFLINESRFRVVKSDCTGCGQCVKACPLHNITMEKGKNLRWNGACTHCLACYHACTHHAVAYGRWTKGKGQVAVENMAFSSHRKARNEE